MTVLLDFGTRRYTGRCFRDEFFLRPSHPIEVDELGVEDATLFLAGGLNQRPLSALVIDQRLQCRHAKNSLLKSIACKLRNFRPESFVSKDRKLELGGGKI
jgi:hypothetical protein